MRARGMIAVARGVGYEGDIGRECDWIACELPNGCDTVSETILVRDRLLAGLAGRPWRYPESQI